MFKKYVKQISSAVGGVVSGLIAGVGSAIPIPILGSSILTGIFPIVAAIAFGLWTGFCIYDELKNTDIVYMSPLNWTVEVIA